jgi:hypothetical protein
MSVTCFVPGVARAPILERPPTSGHVPVCGDNGGRPYSALTVTIVP